MNDETPDGARRPRRAAPEVVAPSNRVTVAFPFSKITLHEPSDELAELASVVAELARLVESLAPGPEAERLSRRALAATTAAGGTGNGKAAPLVASRRRA